jgi:hypothetical protein
LRLNSLLFVDGFQALTLIEFLVKNGSELVVEACRDKVYKVRSLENFNFYEGTVDRGSGVREKSKQIVELLGSNDMIREERAKANNLRNKFVGIGNDGSRGSTGSISQGSNYSGSGGGGSYSNQSDRGFGNSYSDGGSNGGGSGGQDSYSSNSNSRDSRYGNDNDKYSSGGGSSNYSNGGGSDGRYRDEGAYPTETKKKTYDDEPEEEVKIKHKIKSLSKLSAPSSDTAIGGKLKLNIKKEGKLNISNSIPSNQPIAQEIDLLGGGESDFVPAPPSSVISDPFSSHQQQNFGDFSATPQNNTPIQQQNFGDFGDFSATPQAPPVPQYAPQTAPAFDPFAMNNTPPQVPKQQPVQPQLQQQPVQYSQPQQQTQQHQQPNMMSQQGFNQFSSPMQSPQVQPMQPMQQQQQQQQYQPQQSMNNFTPPPIPQSPPSHQQQYQQHQQQQHQQPQQQQSNSMGQHQQQQQQQPQQVPTRGIVKAPEPDYGDFESSNPSAPSAAQVN